jgi:hypothetical protein
MNKFCIFGIGCLSLMLSVLIAGCGGGNGSASALTTNSSVPRSVRGLTFTLSTTRSTFARGEQVPLTLTITNTGTSPANAIGGGCNAMYKVIQGTHDITASLGCAQGGYMVTIAAGGTKTYTMLWNQRDDNGNVVSSGQDSITAWFTALNIDGTQYTAAEAQQQFTTNPVQITVAP